MCERPTQHVQRREVVSRRSRPRRDPRRHGTRFSSDRADAALQPRRGGWADPAGRRAASQLLREFNRGTVNTPGAPLAATHLSATTSQPSADSLRAPHSPTITPASRTSAPSRHRQSGSFKGRSRALCGGRELFLGTFGGRSAMSGGESSTRLTAHAAAVHTPARRNSRASRRIARAIPRRARLSGASLHPA